MKSILTIIVSLFLTAAFAQNLNIDIVSYGNEKNIEYKLSEIVDNFVSTQKSSCLSYEVIEDVNAGQNDIILEVWDSEEFLSQEKFKENRSKSVRDAAGNSSTTSYTASGIRARSVYEIYGRFYERKDGNVLETFKVGGTYDHESPNDEVHSNMQMTATGFKTADADFVQKYEKEYQDLKAGVRSEIDTSFATAVSILAGKYLPPAKITGIAKQKKDKVKKANFEKCDEVEITGGGLFKYPILQSFPIGEETMYRKVGSCYMDPEDGVVGIGGGEKELLPLIKKESDLSIGAVEKMEAAGLSKYKLAKTKDLSFVFMYQQTHNYSDSDRKHIELLCQASFLGYKDIKVIANDPVTEEMNKTFSQSIYTRSVGESTEEKSLLDNLTLEDITSNSTVYVEIGNHKESPLAGKTSFLGQKIDADPDARFFWIKVKYQDGEESYEDIAQMSGVPSKAGLTFNSYSIDAPNVRAAVLDTRIQILGIEEEKKDKVKKVIVSGSTPLDGGTKYEVYDKANYGKKTKALAVLSIDDMLNTYVATAKVKEGDKTIKALINGKKELFIDISVSGGLFGGSSKHNQACKSMSYISAKGDRI